MLGRLVGWVVKLETGGNGISTQLWWYKDPSQEVHSQVLAYFNVHLA